MKKKLHVIILFLVTVGLLTAVLTEKKGVDTQSASNNPMPRAHLQIAYCPTMQTVINQLDLSEKNEFKLVGSSREALNLLSLDKVDGIIIGRKARPIEIKDNVGEFQPIATATTLVSNNYQMIKEEDLTSQIIETDLPKELVNEKYPNLSFIESDNTELINTKTDFKLILWKDLNYSNHDLAIVIDENNKKVVSFRTPFLYYKKEKETSFDIVINNLNKI